MAKLKGKIALLLALILSVSFHSYGNEEERTNRDTVSALVITPTNPLYKSISTLSGEKIVSMIDSLLELENIPIGLIKEINDYAENQLLKHDFYNSLTNYYENSAIPSNSTYGKWDTRNISPYNESITKNDTSLVLTLTDKKNNCNFIAPLQDPVVTSNFGWRHGRNHNGIDLDLQVWDPVRASFDGMVRISLYHPGYGRVVVIRHYNGLETLYAHLHRLKVKAGDIIEAGQVIGLGGNSGQSTGSHLHYEIRYKGKPLNPKHLISFKKNELLSDSLLLTKQKWNYSILPLGLKYHTIQRGDFMFKIANRYGLTVNELCEINGIRRNKVLIVGRKLRIK
ncbi:MAG: peptidoglycan DD-metalloendopeptidase family protein [Flavobacteriales bacterium]|nr:peptidoglycan DD-metalloendopeptidase family protein [Flavobacteriales bacterium]